MSTKIIIYILGFMTTVTGIGFVVAEMKGNYKAKLECIEQTQKLKDENSALKLDYLVLLARYDHQDQ